MDLNPLLPDPTDGHDTPDASMNMGLIDNYTHFLDRDEEGRPLDPTIFNESPAFETLIHPLIVQVMELAELHGIPIVLFANYGRELESTTEEGERYTESHAIAQAGFMEGNHASGLLRAVSVLSQFPSQFLIVPHHGPGVIEFDLTDEDDQNRLRGIVDLLDPDNKEN